MKIAIVTPTFPPYAGGIGNVAASNAKELIQLGHEVTIFTPWYELVKEEMADLNIKRVKPMFKYGNAAFVPALAKMLLGFDIIHLHYPFFGGAEIIWLAQKKLKRQGAKIVLHYHMDVVGQGISKMIFNFHRTFLLPRMMKMADKVILTSMDYGRNSNIKTFLEKNPGKFIEVPNGVDSRIFSPAPKDGVLIAKYQLEPADKIILFVGGLDKAHYFKGIEYLIEAVSRLYDVPYIWKLMIVGQGELQKQYADLASQLNIGHKVIFTDYVANIDLPKHYNLADVSVLPSVDKSEAFGLALVEAMSCAKPVVASDLPGVRSVVDDGVNGYLVRPKDIDDLAKKINFFLVNSEYTQRYGLAGRKKVEEKYDWWVIGRQLEDVYKNLKNP